MSKTIAIELIRVYLAGGQEAVRRHPTMTVLQQKESKDEACYTVTGAPKDEGCLNCRFRITDPINTCSRVNGPIADVGWCMNWITNRPRQEWREAV